MTALARPRPLLKPPGRTSGVVVAALVLAPLAAALGLSLPAKLAFLPLALVGAPAVLALLVASQKMRVLWVIIGGVAALQSSQQLDLIKLTYLAGVAASASIAVVALNESRTRAALDVLSPIFKLSLLLVVALLISSALALTQGTPPTAVLRDIAPFLLFALTPIFAVEANAAFSRGQLLRLFALLGLLGSASFALEWLTRRGFVELPLDRLTLPSGLLPMALFAYAVSTVLHRQGHRRMWEFVGALAITSILVTGTRSGLIVLVAPLVVAAASRRSAAAKTAQLARLAVRYLVAIVIFALAFSGLAGLDLSGPIDRLTSLSASFGGSEAGQSFRQRQAQTNQAQQRLAEAPVFGGGPGKVFHWDTEFGPMASVNIDSPLSVPAKFGVIGTAALGAVLLGYIRLARRARADPDLATPAAALLAYLAIIFLASLIISPLEDKGGSFGLLLLLAMCLPSDTLSNSNRTGHRGAEALPA